MKALLIGIFLGWVAIGFGGPIQNMHAIVAKKRTGGGGGGTSPGLTSILAWYDMADAADADGATYSLTAISSPAYTAGPPSYGTATDGTPGSYWTQASLDSVCGNSAADWSFVCRFRGYTSVTNADRVISMNGGRIRVVWESGGITAAVGNISATSTVGASLNTWYTVVATHFSNGAASTTKISVNGETLANTTGTGGYAAGDLFVGGTSASVTNNIEIDFMGFWGKQLTQDNSTWLYNSGGTRTYSDL